MSGYKGNFICGSYWAKKYGLKEGWWYTWDFKLIRKADDIDKGAGAGTQ